MKKPLITFFSLSLMICLLSFSCKSAEFSTIAKKEFTVDAFSKIEIGGPFNVYIRQGETEQVYVEADERVINKVRVNSENGTLKVTTESIFGNVKKLNVFITLVKVDYMKLIDAGNIESKGALKLEKLKIDYSRTGNMSLTLDCGELILDCDGTGNIDLKGSAATANIHQSGIGNFSANEFKTGILKISVSGVGNTEVYANKEIFIHVSGVGNFTYSGDAVVKEYKVTGTGNVSKN